MDIAAFVILDQYFYLDLTGTDHHFTDHLYLAEYVLYLSMQE